MHAALEVPHSSWRHPKSRSSELQKIGQERKRFKFGLCDMYYRLNHPVPAFKPKDECLALIKIKIKTDFYKKRTMWLQISSFSTRNVLISVRYDIKFVNFDFNASINTVGNFDTMVWNFDTSFKGPTSPEPEKSVSLKNDFVIKKIH